MRPLDPYSDMAHPDHVVSLADSFAQFQDRWSPKIVGQINDLHLKLAKLEGEFVWHAHADTDELFLVVRGELKIELRDRKAVTLKRGEFFIVPRGVEHRPVAAQACEVMLLEPAGTINTGDVKGEGSTSGTWL